MPGRLRQAASSWGSRGDEFACSDFDEFLSRRPMSTPRGDVDAARGGPPGPLGCRTPRVVGALALAPLPAEAPDQRPRSSRAARPTTASSAPASPRSTPSSARAACRVGQRRDPRRRLERPDDARPAGRRRGAGAGLGRGLARPVAQLRPGRGCRPRHPPRVARRHHPGQPRRGALDRRQPARRPLGRPARPRPARRSTGADRQAGPDRRPAPSTRRARPARGDPAPDPRCARTRPAVSRPRSTESTGIRLELARRSWVRLGRDVVGQRTEALVAHNRHGPPGRRATLRILYAEGGERDACLAHDALLIDQPSIQPTTAPTHPARGPRSQDPRPCDVLHLFVPHLPLHLARARRSEPFPTGPLVLGGRPWDPGPVIDADPDARALGVRRGMPLGSAHRLVPEATFIDPDPDADRASGRGRVRGARRVQPEPGGERRPDRCRVRAVRGRHRRPRAAVGPRAGRSSSGSARRCVAPLPGELTPAGRHRGHALRGDRSPRSTPVPAPRSPSRPATRPRSSPRTRPASCTTDLDVRARLTRFGLRRIGAVAELPRSALIARFGEEGARLHARARGEETEPFRARHAPERLALALPIEPPVEDLEPFRFVLHRLWPRSRPSSPRGDSPRTARS